jgi:ABC-type Fe3+/spermidine/putrescine transport system ATPase subunit
MEKLIAKGLYKSFGSAEVLNGIDFTVKDGEFLSVLGASGCGKTTLLRILIGLEKLDSGTILLDRLDITNAPPPVRKMGIVFQNYALFENMTVLRNVEYALLKKKCSRHHARETAERLLEMVHLSEFKDIKPARLSGGQQQRTAIARTLALNPEIILLDEPMSALDVDTRLTLRAELKHLQKTLGTTMIYITHDQEEAFAMSDRIMVMRNGCIEQLATPMEIVNHPVSDYVQEFVLRNIRIKMESLLPYVRKVHSA